MAVLNWQEIKYGMMPGAYRPANIVRVDSARLEYDEVPGTCCRDWQAIVAEAQVALWNGPPSSLGMVERICYRRYVLDRASEKMLDVLAIHEAMQSILLDDLTPVRMTHGDLTFQNVIMTPDGRVVFIDPGNDRGLTCREMDESKILQSLDGLDVVYRGHPQPPVVPRFPTRRVHLALLMTHYIRMLRHVDSVTGAFAQQRIKEISQWLS